MLAQRVSLVETSSGESLAYRGAKAQDSFKLIMLNSAISVMFRLLFTNKLNFFCAIIIFLLIMHIVLMGYVYGYDLPMFDHWRWVKTFADYKSEKISFVDFVSGDFIPFSHSHILTLLFFYFNYLLFDLRFNIETYFGLLVYIVAGGVFLAYFYRCYAQYARERSFALYFCAMAVICFSVSEFNLFAWSLLSFESLYWLIALCTIIVFNQYVIHKQSERVFYGLTVLVYFLGDAIGMSALLAVMAVAACLKNTWSIPTRFFVTQCLIFLLCFVVSYAAFHPFMVSKVGKSDAIIFILSHPGDFVQFMISAFAQSIIDKSIIISTLGKHTVVYHNLLGMLAMGFNIYCIYQYFQAKQYQRTAMPLFLIMFTLVSMAGIALSRLPQYGAEAALWSRYVRLFQISLLGCFWVMADMAFHRYSGRQLRGYRAKSIFFGFLIAVVYIFPSYSNWERMRPQLQYKHRLVNAVHQYSKGDSTQINKLNPLCRKDFCKHGIELLAREKLSVFRAAHPYAKQ